MGLSLGDLVVYLFDPISYGVGLVKGALVNGMLDVEFERDGDFYSESFHPQELELASRWERGEGESLTPADLAALRAA